MQLMLRYINTIYTKYIKTTKSFLLSKHICKGSLIYVNQSETTSCDNKRFV